MKTGQGERTGSGLDFAGEAGRKVDGLTPRSARAALSGIRAHLWRQKLVGIARDCLDAAPQLRSRRERLATMRKALQLSVAAYSMERPDTLDAELGEEAVASVAAVNGTFADVVRSSTGELASLDTMMKEHPDECRWRPSESQDYDQRAESAREHIATALRETVAELSCRRPFLIRWGMAVFIGLVLLSAVSVKAFAYMLSADGIVVTYYDGIDFGKRVCSRNERLLLRNYGRGRPALFAPADRFSARWEGILVVPETDVYGFFSQSDDGLRLYIDGELLIDNWRKQGWLLSGKHARKRLLAGRHRVVVEHFDDRGDAALRIRWKGGPIPPNTVIGVPYLRKR